MAPSAQRLLLSLLWMVSNHNTTAGRASDGEQRDLTMNVGRLPCGQQLELEDAEDGQEVWLAVHDPDAPGEH